MRRTPRPSELYRLPEDEPPEPPLPRPQRRRRTFLVVAGIASLALLAGAVLGDGELAGGGSPPLDVVSEDQVVAALGLYAREQEAADTLGREPDILRPPGPERAANDIAARAESVEQALRAARAEPGADPRAAAYWSDPAHDDFVHRLGQLSGLARDIGLLTAVHDTIYAGAGAIRLDEAEHALVSRFRAAGDAPAPLGQWSDALLAQIDGHDAGPAATEARLGVERYWAQTTSLVTPPAVDRLRDYVSGLPPDLLEALRGHPVAGPALHRLAG
jgi:hypothetical protein